MYSYENAINLLVDKFSDLKSVYMYDKDYYTDLPYLFYESEFINYIKNSAIEKKTLLLKEIFLFIEDIINNGDDKLKNLVDVAIIESLYFENAMVSDINLIDYFGENTLKSYIRCSK